MKTKKRAKQIKIYDKKSAKLYLQNVLKNWTKFCEGHPKMETAIKFLIEE